MPKAEIHKNHRRVSLSHMIVYAALVLVACAGTNPGDKRGELTWATIGADIERDFPRVPRLTTEELVARLKSGSTAVPTLLDIREPDEFNVSHLPGAVLATTLADALEALVTVEKGHPIVVYCSVGYRSGALAKELQEKGYTNVHNLEGSIFKWANEDRPVFARGVQVHSVHPYDETWCTLLDRRYWPESFKPVD